MMQARAAENARIEAHLAIYPPEVSKRAQDYFRTTPLTWRQSVARALRDWALPAADLEREANK